MQEGSSSREEKGRAVEQCERVHWVTDLIRSILAAGKADILGG